MEKENKKNEENFSALEGSDWLDEILGAENTAKELSITEDKKSPFANDDLHYILSNL